MYKFFFFTAPTERQGIRKTRKKIEIGRGRDEDKEAKSHRDCVCTILWVWTRGKLILPVSCLKIPFGCSSHRGHTDTIFDSSRQQSLEPKLTHTQGYFLGLNSAPQTFQLQQTQFTPNHNYRVLPENRALCFAVPISQFRSHLLIKYWM